MSNYQQPQNQANSYSQGSYQAPAGVNPPPGYPQKSRIAAGLLAFFLGISGIHHFYLGNFSRGIVYLLISVLTCGFGIIIILVISIIEGVKILDGRIATDANGVFLKD